MKLRLKTTFLPSLLVVLVLPLVTWAAGNSYKKADARNVMKFEDVEELMDNVSQHDNKVVTVPGEVSYKLSDEAFVLESGGLINDEIVVLIGNDLKKNARAQRTVVDDRDYQVTGTVRTVSIYDIERELGWDLDREVEVELERVKAYLIATDIRSK